MGIVVAFYKPYGVLSQFTPEPNTRWRTLKEFNFPKGIYPVGRLDAPSEGLLILTNEKRLVSRLLHPRFRHARTYWVQVEGIPTEEALQKLRAGGIRIKSHRTLPTDVLLLPEEPPVPLRDPPIRYRKTVPTAWIQMTLYEGKNRQVRRMTAAVGYPTLRLIRVAIGGFFLFDALQPGQWKILTDEEKKKLLAEFVPSKNFPQRFRKKIVLTEALMNKGEGF